MSNETFQIIITAAVVLAFLATIVQVLAALALYRSAREMLTRFSPLLLHINAILAVQTSSIRRIEIVVDKTLLCADIMERVVPRFATLAARTEAVALQAMQIGEQLTHLERSVELLTTATGIIALEMRSRLESVASETSALLGSANTQGRRVSRVFRDAIAHFVHLRENVASR